MAIKRRTTRTTKARSVKTRSAGKTRTAKTARVAKPRTARATTGRRRSTKSTKSARKSASSRVVVVHRPRKASSRGIGVLGVNGFAIKVEGVKGIVHSAWMFGN
jgi:hypothetical protein